MCTFVLNVSTKGTFFEFISPDFVISAENLTMEPVIRRPGFDSLILVQANQSLVLQVFVDHLVRYAELFTLKSSIGLSLRGNIASLCDSIIANPKLVELWEKKVSETKSRLGQPSPVNATSDAIKSSGSR